MATTKLDRLTMLRNTLLDCCKESVKDADEWGVWNLPKMTVGYVCHQYDCDGKTATTIKLDTPVMFFEKPETMFVYGNPRGHLENYTKIG